MMMLMTIAVVITVVVMASEHTLTKYLFGAAWMIAALINGAC